MKHDRRLFLQLLGPVIQTRACGAWWVWADAGIATPVSNRPTPAAASSFIPYSRPETQWNISIDRKQSRNRAVNTLSVHDKVRS
jgi:hypothetical protein